MARPLELGPNDKVELTGSAAGGMTLTIHTLQSTQQLIVREAGNTVGIGRLDPKNKKLYPMRAVNADGTVVEIHNIEVLINYANRRFALKGAKTFEYVHDLGSEGGNLRRESPETEVLYLSVASELGRLVPRNDIMIIRAPDKPEFDFEQAISDKKIRAIVFTINGTEYTRPIGFAVNGFAMVIETISEEYKPSTTTGINGLEWLGNWSYDTRDGDFLVARMVVGEEAIKTPKVLNVKLIE